MKKLLIILLLFTLFCCNDKNDDLLNDNAVERLVINEFLAKNNGCCTDEYGEYDDWVEIYNGNDEPVNIGGMYFSDRRDDPDPYRIPDTDASLTTIPAEGFLVLWCDGQIEQGLLHLDLKPENIIYDKHNISRALYTEDILSRCPSHNNCLYNP